MTKAFLLSIIFWGAVSCAYGQTANEKLYQAIVKRDTVAVRQALNNQADPNYVHAVGPWMKASMLTTAVNHRDVAVVKMLLARKADVNWKDGFNTTALMYAASLGSVELANMLLSAGADAHANDGKGNTVLSAAEESKNMKVIKLIQSKLER